MADLRYTVDVDTRSASTALNGLKSTLGQVGAAIAGAFTLTEIARISARFEDLRVTLGILYKDTNEGAKAFEQIKIFATQSVFSVEDLTASVVKLKAAGLDPTIKQLELFANVASVSADRVGALQAMTDLYARTTAGGLGLEDLNRLADRGIPVFTILAERLGVSRLEVSKLGQSAEGAGIILRALEEGLQQAFGTASTARADTLSQSFSNLQDAITNAADAIGQGGFNDALTEAVLKITQFIEKNQQLLISIGQGLGSVINFAVENLKFLAAALGGVFAAALVGKIIAVVAAVSTFTKALVGAATASAVLQGVTGVGLAKVIAGVAAAGGIITTINSLTADTSVNIEDLQKQLDKLADTSMPEGPLTPPTLNVTPITGDAAAELQKIRDQQDAITRSGITYFQEYKQGVNDIKLAFEQEAKLLKMSESNANVQRELNTFTQRYFNTVRPLQQQVTELRMKDTAESRVQANEIERQIGLITQLYNSSITGLEQTLRLREENRREEEALLLFLDNRRSLQEEFNDLIRESKNELQDLNLTPFERQLAEINRTIDDRLIRSINNIKNAWEDGLITGDEYIAEIKKLEQTAEETQAILEENARANREIQRSFAFGWKTAFESYIEDATNAAQQAQRVFERTTQGMEDAIVNFAKTGKFEFKSFVNTVLEELLRIQIQRTLANIMGTGGSAGGGGSSILGSLFGGFFATGGMIPPGRFGVVGEAGPELVQGPADVTPLTGTSVTYNINAVDASSFKEMLARDPSFLYAVTEQGRRRAPGTRR